MTRIIDACAAFAFRRTRVLSRAASKRRARTLSTVEGRALAFDEIWTRRQSVGLDEVRVVMPSIDDLILTKQVSTRPKDREDIRLLRILQERHR